MMKWKKLILILIIATTRLACSPNEGTETPDPGKPDPEEKKIATLMPTDDTNTKEEMPNAIKGQSLKVDVSGIPGDQKFGFLRFDVSELPPSAEIIKAHIVADLFCGCATGQIDLYLVDGAWSESNLTYNMLDQLNFIQFGDFHYTGINLDSPVSIDVTVAVKQWHHGLSLNHGMALVPHRLSDGSLDPIVLEMFSKEAGEQGIKLVVEYR